MRFITFLGGYVSQTSACERGSVGVAEPMVPPWSRDLSPRVALVDRADPLISLLLGGLLLNGCRLRGDGHGSNNGFAESPVLAAHHM